MIRFSPSGREIVSSVPREVPLSRLGQPPRQSLLEQIQSMVRRERLEQDSVIHDEDDMLEDQLDFEDDRLEDGLLGPSRYEVPEDVPDGFSAEESRKARQEKQNSLSNEDSPQANPQAEESHA